MDWIHLCSMSISNLSLLFTLHLTTNSKAASSTAILGIADWVDAVQQYVELQPVPILQGELSAVVIELYLAITETQLFLETSWQRLTD